MRWDNFFFFVMGMICLGILIWWKLNIYPDDYETVEIHRGQSGFVLYVDDVCFDYPFPHDEDGVFFIFRDGSVWATQQALGKKDVSNDEINNFCKQYLKEKYGDPYED